MKSAINLFCCSLLLLACFNSKAQDGTFFRLESSVGFFSAYNYSITADEYDYYNGTYPDDKPFWFDMESGLPTYNVGFSFYRYKIVELGLDFGYQYLKAEDLLIGHNSQGLEILEDVEMKIATFTPRVRLVWLSSKDDILTLYSSINAGIAIINEDRTHDTEKDGTYAQPTGHLSAVGVRFGSTLAFSMEIGYGSKGMVNFGLAYQFD